MPPSGFMKLRFFVVDFVLWFYSLMFWQLSLNWLLIQWNLPFLLTRTVSTSFVLLVRRWSNVTWQGLYIFSKHGLWLSILPVQIQKLMFDCLFQKSSTCLIILLPWRVDEVETDISWLFPVVLDYLKILWCPSVGKQAIQIWQRNEEGERNECMI